MLAWNSLNIGRVFWRQESSSSAAQHRLISYLLSEFHLISKHTLFNTTVYNLRTVVIGHLFGLDFRDLISSFV